MIGDYSTITQEEIDKTRKKLKLSKSDYTDEYIIDLLGVLHRLAKMYVSFYFKMKKEGKWDNYIKEIEKNEKSKISK